MKLTTFDDYQLEYKSEPQTVVTTVISVLTETVFVVSKGLTSQ